MVSGSRARLLFLVCIFVCAPGALRAGPPENPCRLADLSALVGAHHASFKLHGKGLVNHTLVLGAHRPGESWTGTLTLSHSEGTIYTSVGGERLTPGLRGSLQKLAEAAAADPAIRSALATCANAPHEEAEAAAQSALQAHVRTAVEDGPSQTEGVSGLDAHYIRYALPLLWGLLLLLLGWNLLGRGRRRALMSGAGQPSSAFILGTLMLGGLLLRVIVPPWGPGDISNTVANAQLGADHLQDFGSYGRGVEGLLLLLAPLFGAGEDTLVGLNLAAGTLSIPLLGTLTRQLGMRRKTAHVAALLLAIAPLHIRFSPTYNRYVILIFLMLCGWSFFLAHIRHGGLGALAVATLALTLAPQCRPEAVVIPFATLGLAAAAWQDPSLRRGIIRHRRWLWAALALHLLMTVLPLQRVMAFTATSERWSDEYIHEMRPMFDPTYNAFLNSWITPAPWVFLALAGLCRSSAGSPWVRLWVATMALGFTFVVATRDLGNSHVIDARYHLAALPFYLIFVSSGAVWVGEAITRPLRGRASQVISILLLVALAASAGLAAKVATLRTTMNLEYQFVREHLALVPVPCRIIAFEPDYDLGLRAPFHTSVQSGLAHHWDLVRERPTLRDEDQCVVFYQNASCVANTDVAQDLKAQKNVCVALRKASVGTLAETVLPAIAAGATRYREKPRVGFYWIRKP